MSGIVFNHSVVSSDAINSSYFCENTADSGIQTSSQINKLISKSNTVSSSMRSYSRSQLEIIPLPYIHKSLMVHKVLVAVEESKFLIFIFSGDKILTIIGPPASPGFFQYVCQPSSRSTLIPIKFLSVFSDILWIETIE